MVISDEAVEAAAASWLHDWDTTTDGMRMVIRERMQQALEAAAPYLLAQAWDEGVSYALPGTAKGLRTFSEMQTSNPYRSQA